MQEKYITILLVFIIKSTWATGVMELLGALKLDITVNTKSFALNCKRAVQNEFVAVWNNNLQATQIHFYALIKCLKMIPLLKHTYLLWTNLNVDRL